MPSQHCQSATADYHAVATSPPDEIFTWHCQRHTFLDISELCIHCNKWVIPTAQQFLSTIHKTEPRSVFFELFINHLHANRDSLTSELEDATATYVARHNLALPVVITEDLTTFDPDNSSDPTNIQIGQRTNPTTPTVNLSEPTSTDGAHDPHSHAGEPPSPRLWAW